MEVLRSIRQLEAIRDEWNHLADLQGHALLRHEWFLSAARTLHRDHEIAVMASRSSGRLDALAPLVRIPGYGTSRYEVIGATALHEPTGLLASSASAQTRLLDAVFTLRGPVALQRWQAMSADLAEVQRVARRRGVVLVKETAPTYAVSFGGEGAEQLERLPGKLRYDLKRARTRASEHGAVNVKVLSPSPSEVTHILDAFVRIEASGWKGREGSALDARPHLQEFFRSYCHLSAEAGTLRIFFLLIGESLVAAQIAVEVYERLWVLKIAYDESMSRCSPGFLLNAEAIRYAAAKHLRSYEFLGGAEAWEERWRPERRRSTLVVFYPWTVRGCVGASIHIAAAAWRRIQRGMQRG